jgi:hypothetical protein
MFSISAGRGYHPTNRWCRSVEWFSGATRPPVFCHNTSGGKTLYGNKIYIRDDAARRAQLLHRSVHHRHRFVLIFGFLTNLNSNLSPKLEDIFNLSHAWSNLVTSAWFFAYLVFSVPASKVIEKGWLQAHHGDLAVRDGGGRAAVRARSQHDQFPVLPHRQLRAGHGRLRIADFGKSLRIDPWPGNSAPARLTLAQAFNSLGTAMAPIVVGVFILTDPTKVTSQAAIAHTVQGPYIAIAIALLVLAFIIMFMHLPAITMARDFRPAKGAEKRSQSGRSIWSTGTPCLP